MILYYLRHLSKHFIVYVIGNISTQALVFLLIPVYTRCLTTQDYGIIETLVPVRSVIQMVYVLGLTGAVTRQYFEYESADEKRQYFGTILIFIIPITLIATSFLSILGAPMFDAILKDIPFDPYIKIVIWTAFFLTIFGLPLALFRAREESIKYIILQFSRSFFTILSVIYFVVILKRGALGKVKGEFYASIPLFIACFLIMSKNSRVSFSGVKLKNSLTFEAFLPRI